MIQIGRLLLQASRRDQLIPLARIRLYRRVCSREDGLFPAKHRTGTGRQIENPYLANKLRDIELGSWSLSPRTLNFLEQEIRRQKPSSILEFGSGVSTACIARYMQELHGSTSAIRVYSVEQDETTVANSRKLLDLTDTSASVRLIHSPVGSTVIENVPTTCYSISAQELQKQIGLPQPDFVLIDGPAAVAGARFGTLLLAHAALGRDFAFYLDDAFRDGELEAARRWSLLPYVDIKGLLPTEKGLLVGRTRTSDLDNRSGTSG